MLTEGQTATEEGAPPTQEGAPPTDPPAAPPVVSDPGPSEEYKGLQRALSAAQEENKGLKQQVAAQSVQPSTGVSVQSQAENAYWQLFNAAKAQGMDDSAAQAHGNYGKMYYLWQASQQEVSDIQQRHQQDIAQREVQASEVALVSEMRGMARDLGLDPDNPLLNYGEEGDNAAARVARLRRSFPQVQQVVAAATATAPATPVEPPDRSAERIDSTGSTSPPSGDAERKKKTYLDAVEAFRNGMPGAPGPAAQKALHAEAVAAGAEF